jgi:hypothetical protein
MSREWITLRARGLRAQHRRSLIGMSGKRRAAAGGSDALRGLSSSRLPASGQSGVWVVGRELLSGVVVDEALV